MKTAVFGRMSHHTDCAQVQKLVSDLKGRGVEIVCYAPFAEEMARAGFPLEANAAFGDDGDFPRDADLLLALGGDGTLLTSLTFVRDSGIPVAGVNFGRLGFLTSANAGDGRLWIDDLIAGRCRTVSLMLLSLECEGADLPFYPYAINEISLQKQSFGMLRIEVSIDGRPLPDYWADGIIVATPAGSTAYSLSVGGPIVKPGCEVMIITPIAPHNLNVRPLVVPASSNVTLKLLDGSGALVSADNRSSFIPTGTTMHIARSDKGFRTVLLSDNHFVNALRDKLLWGNDLRNNTFNR